jgi:hypothetical protein
MNEDDAFERELEAFRPIPPSPEMKHRIAERLAVPVRERSIPLSNSQWRMAALVGWLLAASLASVIVWRGESKMEDRDPFAVRIEPDLTSAFGESSPSLWSYRKAFNQSSESLDALLDQHAARMLSTQRSGATLALAIYPFEIDAL